MLSADRQHKVPALCWKPPCTWLPVRSSRALAALCRPCADARCDLGQVLRGKECLIDPDRGLRIQAQDEVMLVRPTDMAAEACQPLAQPVRLDTGALPRLLQLGLGVLGLGMGSCRRAAGDAESMEVLTSGTWQVCAVDGTTALDACSASQCSGTSAQACVYTWHCTGLGRPSHNCKASCTHLRL